MFGSWLKHGLRRFSQFRVSARCSAPLSREFRIQSALIGIFFAVDRRNVRSIFIEIGPSDPIFLAVRVDPIPQDFVRDQSLRSRLALDAHELKKSSAGRKPFEIRPPAFSLAMLTNAASK